MELNLDWLERPILILGYPKSGTSLLNAALDSHPQLVVVPEEVDFFTALYPLIIAMKSGVIIRQHHVNKFLDRLRKSSHIRNMNRSASFKDLSGNADYSSFDYKAFENQIREFLHGRSYHWKQFYISIPFAYHRVMSIASDKNDELMGWVEKTPTNIHFKDFLQNCFPQAKWMGIIRDPRDNYLAYTKKDNIDIWRFIYSWKGRMKDIMEHNNIHKIRYEDLTSNPEPVLKNMASRMGIEFRRSLLQPSKIGIPWYGNSMYAIKHSGITQQSVGRFKSQLEPHIIQLIESYCSELMILHGYDFTGEFNKNRPNKLNMLKGQLLQFISKWKYIYLPLIRARISNFIILFENALISRRDRFD